MTRVQVVQRRCGNRPDSRPGLVLILVLVVVAMLSLAGFTFCEWMLTERQGAQAAKAEAQAKAAAESAVELLRVVVEQPAAARLPGANLYDDPARFCNVALRFGEQAGDDLARLTVLSPRTAAGESGVTFGLDNQSSRLNLHALLHWDQTVPGSAAKALAELPGMTPELAEAVLDWIDSDDAPRERGAESEYYTGLASPYVPTNAVASSLDDLLRVRGMTAGLLYGQDVNRNGVLEPFEMPGNAPSPGAVADSLPPGGLASLLTVCSAEANRNADGRPRIDLNQPNLQTLYEQLVAELDEEAARFIVAYRQFGASPAFLATRQRPTAAPDFSLPAQYSLNSPWDLVDAKVLVKSTKAPQQVILESPWRSQSARLAESLDRLLDGATTVATPVIVGRVNVLLAPVSVLKALPGLDEATAEALAAKRPKTDAAGDAGQSRWAWLVEGNLLPLAKLKQIGPLLTTGGDVFTAQVVGFGRVDGPRCRAEVWLDATQRPSRVLLWKDLGRLGAGYPYELLTLHSGAPGAGL